MRFQYILFLLIMSWAFTSWAQLDSAAIIPVREHSHVIEIDTLQRKNQSQRDFLHSRRPLEVAGLLNQLAMHNETNLKSASEYVKLDSVVTSAWQDETQAPEKTEKIRFDTDDDEREMILRYYTWNTETRRWQIDRGNYYFFGSNGQLDSTEFQEYVVGTYRRYIQTLYTYENDLVRYALRREKIDEIEIWEELDRTKYDYDSNGRLSHVYSQERDAFDNRWATYFYIEYTRDSMGNVVQETGYDYERYDGISTRKYYLTYDYDDKNRLEMVTEYVKGWQEGQFIPDRKQLNSYDDNSELLSETYYDWDYDANDWLTKNRLIYDHTVSGEVLQAVISQNWNQQWTDSRKAIYSTDHFYTLADVRHTGFLNAFVPFYSFSGIVCERIENLVQQNNTWTDAGTTTYYFSADWPTRIEDRRSAVVNVYPNPVSDILTVEKDFQDAAVFVLYDLSGRIVWQTQITNRLTMDVSWLTSGFYLLEVRHNSKTVYSGKLVKK